MQSIFEGASGSDFSFLMTCFANLPRDSLQDVFDRWMSDRQSQYPNDPQTTNTTSDDSEVKYKEGYDGRNGTGRSFGNQTRAEVLPQCCPIRLFPYKIGLNYHNLKTTSVGTVQSDGKSVGSGVGDRRRLGLHRDEYSGLWTGVDRRESQRGQLSSADI